MEIRGKLRYKFASIYVFSTTYMNNYFNKRNHAFKKTQKRTKKKKKKKKKKKVLTTSAFSIVTPCKILLKLFTKMELWTAKLRRGGGCYDSSYYPNNFKEHMNFLCLQRLGWYSIIARTSNITKCFLLPALCKAEKHSSE